MINALFFEFGDGSHPLGMGLGLQIMAIVFSLGRSRINCHSTRFCVPIAVRLRHNQLIPKTTEALNENRVVIRNELAGGRVAKNTSDSPTSNQGTKQAICRANIMPKIIDGSIQLN